MRVLVLTAPVGEGHLAAARVLADDIATLRPDASVVVVDVLPRLPQVVSWLVRDAYRWQLDVAPWLFALLFGALRRSRGIRAVSRWLVSLTCSRSIVRVVREADPDIVVSTWPVTTAALGCLRLRGRLRVPVCATITDFAGLELWADRGVDLHLVMHPALVAPVERIAGEGSVEAVAPIVGAEFRVPNDRDTARQALGLPANGRVVLVSGGGWGVGDLEGAAVGALELEDSTVVCLAGRDESARAQLEQAFAGEPRVSVLGFTDRMNDLLAAADVLVHSTGGVTCLEAIARGCRIVAYRPPPGHSPLLAREMSRLGLLAHARSPAELREALSTGVRASSPEPGASAALRILALRPRVRSRLRSRLARPLAVSTTMALTLSVLATSTLAYRSVAEVFQLPDETVIGAQTDEIGIVVDGRGRDLDSLARSARGRSLDVSVAARTLTAAEIRRLRAAGLEPIPVLGSHGLRTWLQARTDLRRQERQLGLRRPFVYLAPVGGLTVSSYLIARHLGGEPVPIAGTLPLARPTRLEPGTVETIELGSGLAGRRALLLELSGIERSGLTPVSVTHLLAARGTA